MILTVVGNAVGILIWCHIDARERHIPLGPGFRILVILLGPIALIYYIFRSRGFSGGLHSIGWLLLYFGAILVLVALTDLALALISDRLGVFE